MLNWKANSKSRKRGIPKLIPKGEAPGILKTYEVKTKSFAWKAPSTYQALHTNNKLITYLSFFILKKKTISQFQMVQHLFFQALLNYKPTKVKLLSTSIV